MKNRHYFYFVLVGILLCTSLFISCGGSSGGGGGDGSNSSAPSDGYTSGSTAPMSTSPEMKSAASDGDSTAVTLGDGTRVEVPELEGAWEAQLERDNADNALKGIIDAITEDTGLVSTGAMRKFSVSGEGDPSNLKPVITIPKSEAGTIDLETINVLRVGDVLVDGQWVTDHAMTLPASTDGNGNIRFVDPLMADGLVLTGEMAGFPALGYAPAADESQAPVQHAWVGSSRYILMTFQDDLNWRREPRLVRMIPEHSDEAVGYRRPATEAELAELAKKPICNMVLLVHGHHEDEKGGIYETTEELPWLFAYKRRVWDIFYNEILDEKYPTECTAFYEYIYPTYRPIFSPVSDKSGVRHETLGEAMGRLVEEEIEKNSQLEAMLDEDMDFNIVVAAHSQGGLVARAGFRHLPEKFKKRLYHFVSWGTPHHGAALYTLRYALQSGYDMVVDGFRLPLQNIRNSMVTGSLLKGALNAHAAIDAPGIRDLRWDAAHKNMLTILSDGEPFPEINAGNLGTIDPPLFSENLKTFNQEPYQEKADSSLTYTFLAGITPKTAELEIVDVDSGWWWQYRKQQMYRMADGTGIEKGAALNRLMMSSGNQSSDGAVPIFSQRGADIYTTADYKTASDMDHEEFYGSEPPQRSIGTKYKGALVARETLGLFRLEHESRECPYIETDRDTGEDETVLISGRVVHPLYEETKQKVGYIIDRIEARAESQEGDVIGTLSFDIEDDGSFTGEGTADGAYVVVAVFKDGSEVVNQLKYDLMFYEDDAWSWENTGENFTTRFKANPEKCINAQFLVYDAHIEHPSAIYIIFIDPSGADVSSWDRDDPFYPEEDDFRDGGRILEIDYGICGTIWDDPPLGEYTVEVLDQNRRLLISKTFELY